MDNFGKLREYCLCKKTIVSLIEIISEDIRISEKSIPQYVALIKKIMNENVNKLSRPPRNNDEMRNILRHLNKLCINTVKDVIVKKYPELIINRKKQLGREQMRRDLDVYGERENHFVDRPHSRSKKEYSYSEDDDDQMFGHKNLNNVGCGGIDSFSGYASAFGNHSISNGLFQNKLPDRQSDKTNSRFGEDELSLTSEQRYQKLLAERNAGGSSREERVTPDFTLDGSGEKVRKQKLLKKMEDHSHLSMSNDIGGMNAFGGICGFDGMSSFDNGMGGSLLGGNDDIYASLLGAGSPNASVSTNQNPNPNNPFMGMGNPLMSVSSTNHLADQYAANPINSYNGCGGFGTDPPSAKSIQFNNDLEKLKAERHQMDIETGQPSATNPYPSNSMYGMTPNMMGMNGVVNNNPNTLYSQNMMNNNFSMNNYNSGPNNFGTNNGPRYNL